MYEKIWVSATIDHDRLKELIEAGEQFFNGDCRYHFMDREGSVKRVGKVAGVGIQFSINIDRHLLINIAEGRDAAGVWNGKGIFGDYLYTIKHVQNWDDLLVFAKEKLIEHLEKEDDNGV